MADVAGAEGGQAVRRQIAAVEGLNLFAAMEDIIDKLKLLDYESRFCGKRSFKPMNHLYFALPGKPSEQFPYFSSLIAWIFKDVIGLKYNEWNEFDDPTSIANNIIGEMRKLGFNADFPVSKLRHGSGDAIILTLDFAVNKALEAQRFKVQLPQYSKIADISKEGNVEAEDVSDDAVVEEVDNGNDTEADDSAYASYAEQDTQEEKVVQPVLEAKVDPAIWKLEIERVGPRLNFKTQANTKEWRTHLEQTEKHGAALNELFPKAKVNIAKISEDLQKTIERISAKERHINREFENLGRDFREKQMALDTMQTRYNELSEAVARLTSELAAKTEAVETLKSQMENQNNSMTDTAPLRKIQAALASLKKETADLELRIGVATQTLLHANMSAGTQGKRKKEFSSGDLDDPLQSRSHGGSSDYGGESDGGGYGPEDGDYGDS